MLNSYTTKSAKYYTLVIIWARVQIPVIQLQLQLYTHHNFRHKQKFTDVMSDFKNSYFQNNTILQLFWSISCMLLQINSRKYDSLPLLFSKIMNKQQITQVLVRHIPELSHKKCQLQRLSGLTNITYGVIVDGEYTYFFKNYSKNLSHEFEHKIQAACSQQGLGPRCIYFNQEYAITEFIPKSRAPNQTQIVTAPLASKIMQKLYSFHQLDDPFLKTQGIITSSHYLFSKEQQKEITDLKLKNNEKPNYQKLLKQITSALENREELSKFLLPDSNQNVRICHNDLNNLNILVTQSSVYLIDYDYAGYNFIAFDIANTINETSLDYSKTIYPGFEVIKHYTPQEIYDITKHYPGYYPELPHEVLKFMCVVNLYWAIWSLKRVQLNVSQIFGILQHGLKRMQLFFIYYKLTLNSVVRKD